MKSTKMFLVLVCVLLAGCALSGCLGSDDLANNSTNNSDNSTNETIFTPVTVVTATQNTEEGVDQQFIFEFNGTITPQVNEVVEIQVAGNPTTGYQWTALMSENSTLKLLGDKYIEDEHKEGMAGVGGTFVWYITSDTAGTYIFDAVYSRSWENETDPISFELSLTFVE